MQQSPPEPSVRTDASRRQVVVLSAVTALAGGALAACGGSDEPVAVGAAASSPVDDASPTDALLDTAADPSAVESVEEPAEESDSELAADETTSSKAKTSSKTAKKTTAKTSDKAAEKSDETDKADKTTAKTSSKKATSKSTAPAEDFSKGSLIKLSKVPVGGSVKVGGTIVTRTGSNSVVGLSTVCTHQGCAVAPQGAQLVCPCHDSRFNNKTGAVLGGPAPSPLPKVGLVVKGGYVHRA